MSDPRQAIVDEIYASLHELYADFPNLDREFVKGVSFAARVVLGSGTGANEDGGAS